MTDTAPQQPVPERVERTCNACGQTDTHPHHIFDAAITYPDPITGQPVTEDKSVSRHFDCCNCPHCGIVLDHAGERRGLDLADFVIGKPPELHASLRAAGYDVED